MNKNRQLLLTFILLLLFIILSCDPYKKLAEERAEKAASNEEISIAIVDSFRNTSLFEEGVRLAIKEINESGGLHGKTITPIFYDDELDPVLGQKISENIVQNTDIVAVIGHKNSNVAIPVSITYERSGLLFISTGAAKPELTQYGGFYTFRNIPSDEVSGKAAALFMKDKGYKKVLIIFDEDSEASQLVKIFGASAVENGIKIVAEKTYSNWETDFRLLIGSLMRKYEFDCVFLGGELVAVANMIKQMREMGIDKPIMGNDSLDSQKFWEIAGKAGENTIVFTVFDPNLPETATQDFVEAFKTEYDSAPDTLAAQAYDAIQVFSHAVEKGGTTVPIVVGNTLRLIKDWKGVTGPYSFNWNGGIEGKSIFFKQAGNQKFEFLHSKSKDKVNLFNPLEEITLRIPVANRIDTIDPGLAIKPVDLDICEQLFLNLTDFDHKTYEVIPELAKRMQKHVQFILIGDGGRKPELQAALDKAGCTNVELRPPVNRDDLIDAYNEADMLFLHLNDYKAFRKVLPSKLFEYAALSKPIWAGVSGYAAKFVKEEIENSVVFHPCDIDDAVHSFGDLIIKNTARTKFIKKFARVSIMDNMSDEILNIIKQDL